MSDKIYGFDDVLQKVYSDVHRWIEKHEESNGYKNLSHQEKKEYLDGGSLKYVATQFHFHFHNHYFKAIYLLENLVPEDMIRSWIRNNPYLVFIDAGCGAGAASVAYINYLTNICETERLKCNIFCLGLDPDVYAIALYNQTLSRLKSNLDSNYLTFDFKPQLGGLPDLKELSDQIENHRILWNIPRIPHATVFRMNVDRPLSTKHDENNQKLKILEQLGVSNVGQTQNYGINEADAYEEFLLNKSKIDNLNIIGVATRGLDKQLTDFYQQVTNIFNDKGHHHNGVECESYRTFCLNPKDSASEENTNSYLINYFAIANYIVSKDLINDIHWNNILSLNSLRLAWARARRNLIEKEALFDEIEIRIFEADLDNNLSQLAEKLKRYVADAIQVEDVLAYRTLKSKDRQRPRGLTRLEEEILFASIIQDASIDFSGRYPNSFAYSLNPNKKNRNEYLYKSWFSDYQQYVNNSRESAQKYKISGTVIQTDIEKFYEKIIQHRLLEIAESELYRYSSRIEWLLQNVILREHYGHNVGKGLTQGSIGSGFFANVYLAPLHSFFNKYDVEFFRYVDDMMIIVKDKNEASGLLDELRKFLKEELDLNLNEGKTQIYEDVETYLEATKEDDFLSSFYEAHQQLVNTLWMGQGSFQKFFRIAYNDEVAWWRNIEIYQKCLQEISVYIDLPTLSRRISTYLPDSEYVNKKRSEAEIITIPILPESNNASSIKNWAKQFDQLNSEYVTKLEKHRKLLNLRFQEFSEVVEGGEVDKEMARKIRFVVNRLAEVGFQVTADHLVTIINHKPWLLDVSHIFEYMGLNGLYSHLNEILDHYNNKKDTSEREYVMAMGLRAIRYFPNISKTHTFRLLEYGTRSPSVIEKIMATETILIRRGDIPEEELVKYLPKIAECLTEDNNSRLEKNYILLLGQDISQEFIPDSSNQLLKDAHFLALNGNVESIFKDVEPAILRKEFYGRKEFYEGQGY